MDCVIELNRWELYAVLMALVRILVDGYSLLHRWPELAPGAARHSERARDALTELLQQYQDASGTPVTVFFDGQNSGRGPRPKPGGADALEILFSGGGRTADDLIERAAHRFQSYGEVLVVTDDFAERDTVAASGALVASCANFISMIDQALTRLQDNLNRHNRAARNSFRVVP
jgi:predicted RNA-binding protein with PIN domain